MADKNYYSACYRNRFTGENRQSRQKLWDTLVKIVFQRLVSEKGSIMDIGAGYCEFLRSIKAREKFAVDLNPDTITAAGKEITIIRTSADKIPAKYDGLMDVIMMSNFLEHLYDKDAVLRALRRSFKLLKKHGLLIIMGPNIDLVKSHYWNFFDHQVPLNGDSYQEGIKLAGFEIESYTEKFFPYSTKSSLPLNDLLIRIYLMLPPQLRPLAGQSLFIARKPNG